MREIDRQEQAVVWRRHDLPGHEACRLMRVDAGWHLEGAAVFTFEGRPCRFDYLIDCDRAWVTRSACVRGWNGNKAIDVHVARDGAGQWSLDGDECRGVEGTMDVDLGFSPSTNMLPIRRLALDARASARPRAAWLTFPDFELEPLEQRYTRLDEGRYRYESTASGFEAELTVDALGMVIQYGRLWSRDGTCTDL